ncbi:MAG: class I SAM-dependent methyltransferase [Phycisphaeraceae bacterium]
MTEASDEQTKQGVALAVAADPPEQTELLRAAARLAVDLDLPLVEKPVKSGYDMLLTATPGRLELRILRGDAQLKGGKAVAVELDALDTTSPAGRSLKQPIAKAIGLKRLKDLPITVIDATAGWGEDAWLLASLGCHVLAVERHPVVATLLRDGLLRAGAAQPAMLSRLSVVTADARHLLRRIARRHEDEQALRDLPASMRDFLEPDVVYLDPMFPGADARKAAERKPLRVLRKLVGDDGDARELFDWALLVARRRVVVKRPNKAPPIREADPKPTTAFAGKGFRFDVYVVK